MELTLDQALQKGIEAHKAGKVQEADRYYTAILKAKPKHPDANHNMGVLAVGIGKVNQALPFFKRALEVKPNIAQYWKSYIDALIRLGLTTDAKHAFDEAKKKSARRDGFDQIEKRLGLATKSTVHVSGIKDPPQNQLQILINLYTQRQFEKALNEASQLLTRYPNSAFLYNIIGVANKGLGRLDEAITAYNEAITIKPDHCDAFYNMGNILKDQGKLDEAIASYNEAIKIQPDHADAYYNMGNALKDQGKLDEAITAYNEAITIKPDYDNAYYNLGIALRGFIFNKPNRKLQDVVISILNKQTYVSPVSIARAVISLLKLEPNLRKQLQLENYDSLEQLPLPVISELNKFPLLLKIMKVCPLPDLELEALLRKLRASILKNISSLKTAPNALIIFQSSLAQQCFTNEYVYNPTKEEEKNLQTLEKIVKTALENNEQPSPQEILALASYKQLNQYDWSESLIVQDEIQEVFARQVEEPRKENVLKSKVCVLQEITDNVSLKVKEQYEENPYPRWVNLPLPLVPVPISKMVGEINLKIYDEKIIAIEAPKVLIAGCGTGQHSITTAAKLKSSKILAIDLSLSSLAYAQRKTNELGIENIEYMQADILNLGALNKQFDIIESSGVLHHMHKPIAGWKVLTDCLKPRGLMRIGLYSELSRPHIAEMREEISQRAIGSSDLEMRCFRDAIVGSDKKHHRMIYNANDFYSLSMFRDLLFHVQEHRFIIPQIKDCLKELGLKFCGFESPEIVSHFKRTNTNKDDLYDLDRWHFYEEANPSAFTGMYQFWCQKVD